MLHLHHSNRLERLCDRLAAVVASPLVDPLTPERVVVQNPGMARWLAQGLAERLGVAANLSFPLPATFFWSVLDAWFPDLPEEAPLDRETLLWRVMAALPGLLADPAFAEPAAYLAGEPADLKRLQLARRIADLFDQYLVYRPDRILAWERREEHHWQARLWRAVVGESAGRHRAALLERFSAVAATSPVGALPERVALFGLTALPPAYLQMLAGVAYHCQVHLFLLNPCREYWADLVAERTRTRRRACAFRARVTDTSALLDVGNPLLAAMGHAGQEFLDLLLELGGEDQDDFLTPPGDGLLARLQGDILALRDGRRADAAERIALAPEDRSLRLNVCHSRLREVQVLHDELLGLFDAIHDLQPRDVLVMAPDIDEYAGLVDAVFAAAEPQIPWSVADRRAAAGRPLLAAFDVLLGLPTSRLTASEVLALLEVPAVQRRHDLDAAGLARLRDWIRESGVRWGLDGPMRATLDLPDEEANTWVFGLRRLFLGYALPPDQDLWRAYVPYPDLEAGEAAWLGALQELISRLAAWRADLARPRTAGDWQAALGALQRDFFAPDREDELALETLREALDRLVTGAASAGFTAELRVETLAAWLRERLAEPQVGHRFLIGGVSFCNLVPMRSLPFRVVCLLGLNDRELPRDQRPLAFDLIAAEPRRGDRSRRRDDRYLFLEALLSARDRLVLSYVGRDQRDNSPRVPSVLVSELVDYVAQSYRLADGGDLLAHLSVEHPLQPFSRRYFHPAEPRLRSYAVQWLAAARAEAEQTDRPFADQRLEDPEESSDEVELDDLIRFLGNPASHFLTRRLGLRLPEEAEAVEDCEVFDPKGLTRYGLRDLLLDDALVGADAEATAARLRGRGWLPHGGPGDLWLAEEIAEAQRQAERVRPRLAAPGEPRELDLDLGGCRLRGWLPPPGLEGLVSFRPGELKAKDRLRLWVRHLAGCALDPETRSIHLARDKTLVLAPVADPPALLADLLAIYRQGLCEPVAFFPETSLAWAETGERGSRLRSAWDGDYNGFAESRDAAVQIAWRGRDPLAVPAFPDLAGRIWGPCLAVSTPIPARQDWP
jgi:exodeoxyribonuclease V gamma subunit